MTIKKPDKSGFFSVISFFGNALWQRYENLPCKCKAEPRRSGIKMPSAKGFFESFYNFTERKKNTARVFFFFWQRYKDSNLK